MPVGYHRRSVAIWYAVGLASRAEQAQSEEQKAENAKIGRLDLKVEEEDETPRGYFQVRHMFVVLPLTGIHLYYSLIFVLGCICWSGDFWYLGSFDCTGYGCCTDSHGVLTVPCNFSPASSRSKS